MAMWSKICKSVIPSRLCSRLNYIFFSIKFITFYSNVHQPRKTMTHLGKGKDLYLMIISDECQNYSRHKQCVIDKHSTYI